MSKPPVSKPSGPFGLFDPAGNCWLGDAAGPKLFDVYCMAQVAAQVADVRLGNPEGTTIAALYIKGPLRLKDEIETKMDSLTALKLLEGDKRE